MAIDMVEYNELSALAPSRLGFKNFADDMEYANLFGSRKKKIARRSESTRSGWTIDPTKENDCEYLQSRMFELQATIQNELSKKTRNIDKKTVLYPLQDMEVKYKVAIKKAKCEEMASQSELEKSKQEALSAITQASTVSDTEGGGTNKTTKYILYGVGGLIVVVGLLMVLRRG